LVLLYGSNSTPTLKFLIFLKDPRIQEGPIQFANVSFGTEAEAVSAINGLVSIS
jgi:hypothetical protein